MATPLDLDPALPSLALLTDVPLDSAWQAPPVDNLLRVIQGVAVMELPGMAHQDIPP